MKEQYIPDDYVNSRDAVKLLGISTYKGWKNLVQECGFKSMRIGRFLYYKKSDLLTKYDIYMKQYIANKLQEGLK
jgi:hypothetical protein